MASTESSDPSDLVHTQASSVSNSSNDLAIPTPPNPYFSSSIVECFTQQGLCHEVLMGLNENFEILHNQILTYDPLPSMSKVYSLVLQEEPHKTIGHGGSSASPNDVVAMYANSKSNSGNTTWNKGNEKKERPFCTHCNILGHTIEKCYKLHGYPPEYKPKGKGNAIANRVSSTLSSGADNSSSRSNLCPISKAQCEQLLAYLTTSLGVGDALHVATVRASSVAGVDCNPSGATDHMVYFVSCFTSITVTFNTHVNLPNGEVTFVTHIGTVRISDNLLLQNVLCVPSFTFNLISVCQLAKSILCCLIFFGNLYFIQDLAHWSMIGLGKEINGLYLLQKEESTSTLNFLFASISDFANKTILAFINKIQPYIWHARLGHLSDAKLALLNKNNVEAHSLGTSIADSFVTPISILDSHTPSHTPDLHVPVSFPNDLHSHDLNANLSNSVSHEVDTSPYNPLNPSSTTSPPLPISSPALPLTWKSTRVHKTPAYLQDYACNSAASIPTPGLPYALSNYLTYSHLHPPYQSYLMTVSACP
ncbi:hypothetical protein ACB092_06G176100 [Castanea dentata]